MHYERVDSRNMPQIVKFLMTLNVYQIYKCLKIRTYCIYKRSENSCAIKKKKEFDTALIYRKTLSFQSLHLLIILSEKQSDRVAE